MIRRFRFKFLRQWELYGTRQTERYDPHSTLYLGQTARVGGWWFCFRGWLIYTFWHLEPVLIRALPEVWTPDDQDC